MEAEFNLVSNLKYLFLTSQLLTLHNIGEQ